jgi:hypothetical protein
MFKIMVRIFFILLIASLVGGGLYFFANTSAGQALIQNGRGGGGFERGERIDPGGGLTAGNTNGDAAFQPGPRGGGGGERDFHGEGGSPRALLDLVKNAGIIGLITAGVVLLQKVWGGARQLLRRRSLKPAAS